MITDSNPAAFGPRGFYVPLCVGGGPYVDGFQLKGGIAVPFVFFHGKHHIERFFTGDELEFIGHKETDAGKRGAVALADGELDVLVFHDAGKACIGEVAGQEYGPQVLGAQRFELAENIIEGRSEVRKPHF